MPSIVHIFKKTRVHIEKFRKEGKQVLVHLPKKDAVAATVMLTLLAITLIATLLPRATATPALTISIDPTSGIVGTEVEVNGTIDTPNGSYTIRWDQTLNVTTGYATESNVTTSFMVPQTVGAPSPGRNVLIELIDNDKTVDNVVNTTFKLYSKYYVEAVVPSPPSQLQEGETTEILLNVTGGEADTVYSANITVTDPSGAVHYNDTLQLTNTENTGYGEGDLTYPEDFSIGANTDYVGMYTIAFNGTLATANFTIGLTDRLEYQRGETVSIQGSGYGANENVTVKVAIAKVPVAGYPKNVTADANGVVIDQWAIPEDTQPGNHIVTITNATSGTVKTPADSQDFTVARAGAVCLIQTWNLADPPEPVAGVRVEARNATTDTLLEAGNTNQTGLIEFSLELDNYTFEAFLMIAKDFVPVGRLRDQSITETRTYKLNLTCQLSHVTVTVHDEDETPLPFIDITLTYTYITRGNQTIPQKESFETNSTGIVASLNTIANVSYEIEAGRYGHPFNRTLIDNLTSPLWVNITCPTYNMFVHALDSKGLPIQSVDVDVIEWGSGIRVDRKTTNTLGSIAFSHIFGRYKVKVYNGSALLRNTVVLNETAIDLIEDGLFLPVYCKIYNIDLSLSVIDYFGQPIPDAVVKVERDDLELASPTTGKDGTTALDGIIGGDLRFSVYILGKLGETRTSYVDGDKKMVFKIDRYVVVGGYPLESVQFIALVSLSILGAILASVLIYRRISITRPTEDAESSTPRE